MTIPHNKKTVTLVMNVLEAHPNEWMTASDISRWLKNVTPSQVGCFVRILASTDDRIERIITSSHRRIYRFNEVNA